MSSHRRDVRPRYGRIAALAASVMVFAVAALAGVGVLATSQSSAGALGWMQFMPATWAAYGVDGDGDGATSITSDADSVFAAANYLAKSGVTKGEKGVRAALFAYNHATWYVNDVLHYAHAYGGGTVLGDPTTCPVTQAGNPTIR